MKNLPSKRNQLLVSVEKVRDLTQEQLARAQGGKPPCPNTRPASNCDTTL